MHKRVFFYNATPPTENYTLPLHDPLRILPRENPTVYRTESGWSSHKANHKYIVGKDNTTAVTLRQAKASGYDACTWCFGHSGT